MAESLYETHVTVHCDSPDEWERLRSWAAEAGFRATRIELARGRKPSQPMLTLRGSASYAQEYAHAYEVAARLRADGFAPVRVKIESAPRAAEAVSGPASAGAERPCDGGYFEHHVKLRLPAGADLEALAALVVPHGAHLSWNARRVLGGGLHERFVTQRVHEGDAATAGRALDALLARLTEFEVVEVEREFVLHDSDVSVDDGWLAAATTRGTAPEADRGTTRPTEREAVRR
ncbi:hypothetical protein ACIQU5_04405 [Streptomyces sp. NPDC090306]|uniref:hypothetical protein n=1 Tax=Streptomyces sp. NPDC090306 TaxID=3365961 RepID=UPI003811404B